MITNENSTLTAKSANYVVNCTLDEWNRIQDFKNRRLFLYGSILPLDEDLCGDIDATSTSRIIENIMKINAQDKNVPIEERRPIKLFINSLGGDIVEGFALVSAIEASKTPIYTINIGQWSSMSFLIGIAGHKRYSLPYMTFLMHDGSSFALGSVNKMQDKMEFEKRFENEVVKNHVLKHSNMKPIDYDALARVEVYMLPEDALERGFIDDIIVDIDDIL